MNTIKIYTDWSCLGNPWPWGYAAILMYKENTKNIVWSEPDTTNNRMELMWVIKALESIKKQKIPIKIFVDSRYIKDWITKYMTKWKQNNWKLSNKQPVKNKDLWEYLDKLIKKFDYIERNWVKAHNDNPMNELVDKLARKEAKKIAQQI